MAPSTIGTFLRVVHLRACAPVGPAVGQALGRAWHAGAGPGEGRLVIDVDSFVGEVFGTQQAGRGVRLHPCPRLSPDPRDPRRHRRGDSDPPADRARRTPPAACGALHRRADRPRPPRRRQRPEAAAGRFGVLEQEDLRPPGPAGWQFSIGVRLQPAIRAAIEAIPEDAWITLDDYPETSIAQIAETTHNGRRLDRPPRPHPRPPRPAAAELGAVSVHHQPHRRRSRSSKPSTANTPSVELAIRDLKDQALAHFPSGHFFANAAWTVIAVLAHNLLRQTQLLDLPTTTDPHRPDPPPPAAHGSRPPGPHRPTLDAAPPSPLALGRRLHRSAHPHPRARLAGLTPPQQERPHPPQPAGRIDPPPPPSKQAPPTPNGAARLPNRSALATTSAHATPTATDDSSIRS